MFAYQNDHEEYVVDSRPVSVPARNKQPRTSSPRFDRSRAKSATLCNGIQRRGHKRSGV